MEHLFNDAGEPQIIPSRNSSHHDFEFNFGKWNVHNRKLKKRLQNSNEWMEFEATNECHGSLNGFATSDLYRTEIDGEPFEGLTVRLFNPKTRLWSIYWADSKVVVLDVPVVGSFDGPIGRFYAKDVWEGKKIVMQFHWDKTNPETPIWSQAFSADKGRTWEWNWYMTMTRQG